MVLFIIFQKLVKAFCTVAYVHTFHHSMETASSWFCPPHSLLLLKLQHWFLLPCSPMNVLIILNTNLKHLSIFSDILCNLTPVQFLTTSYFLKYYTLIVKLFSQSAKIVFTNVYPTSIFWMLKWNNWMFKLNVICIKPKSSLFNSTKSHFNPTFSHFYRGQQYSPRVSLGVPNISFLSLKPSANLTGFTFTHLTKSELLLQHHPYL